MGSIRYWYNNGEFEDLTSNPKLLSRILLNADKGLKLSWRTSGTRIPFYIEQFKLLHDLAIRKNINLEAFCGMELLLQDATSLLRRNRIFKGALISIFLIDQENFIGMYILCEIYPDEKFIINNKGIQLGWLKDISHPGQKYIAGLLNSQQRISLWDKQLAELKIDSAYLINDKNKLVECVDANIFIIKGDILYTPSENTGAFPRAIRKEIIRKSRDIGLKAVETDKLEPAHLDAADEIFLANDIFGIRWVVAYNNNRFFRKYSELLVKQLNLDWEREI